jgi:hypothetical protein
MGKRKRKARRRKELGFWLYVDSPTLEQLINFEAVAANYGINVEAFRPSSKGVNYGQNQS